MKTFDVAIAGGGLIGATIAFECARAGLTVGLFDRQKPGEEASWAAAGILSPAPENAAMVSMVPLGRASLALYPEFVAAIQEASGEPVGYRPTGALEAFFSRNAQAQLSTVIALHHGMGLKAEPLSAQDARELEPALSPELEAAILRPDEASVDNRALTRAALIAAERAGARIFPSCNVQAIHQTGLRCNGLLLANETIEARWTVIASGSYSAEIQGVAPYAPVRPAKGQMLALRAPNVPIERVLCGRNMFISCRATTDGSSPVPP